MNEQLLEKFRDAVKSSLLFLQQQYPDYNTTDHLENNIRYDEAYNLPEVQTLFNYLTDNTELHKSFQHLFSPWNQSTVDYVIKLQFTKFLFEYIRQSSLTYDEEKFNSLYHELEDYLYGKACFHYYAPLSNFDSDIETIDLADIIIRKVTEEDFPKFSGISKEMITASPLLMTLLLKMPKFVVELRSRKYNLEEMENKIRELDYTFNLFKQEIIEFRQITCVTPKFYPVETSSTREVTGYPQSFYSQCKLGKSEFNEFKRLYEKFVKTPRPSAFNVAVRRFNSALKESKKEDKIIDLNILLEALFNDSEGEMRYKISTRAAVLLSKNLSESHIVRQFLKDAYDDRSIIVHGDELDHNLDLVKLTELAQKSLLAYLNMLTKYHSKDDIIKKIDDSNFDPELKKELQQITEVEK